MPSRRAFLTGTLGSALLAVAACSGDPAVPAATADATDGSAAPGTAVGPTTIRFALDWTPNTNHTGLYVALQQGWFAEIGLDVQVLPYSSALPDTLIDAGAAEFGISFQDSSARAQAAGAGVVSVFAVLQHWATAIGVRADRDDLTSPKNLDGLTYAGFGDPVEQPLLQAVIRDAGGTGDFTTVTLGTSAYEALYSGDVDFTIPFTAWEGIEAERNGTPMKYFHYTDYGFPDAYAVVVDGSRSWIRDHPEQARAFLGVLQRGYQLAADYPDTAAELLIKANPGAFTDEDLVKESQRTLAADLLKSADGTVGPQDAAQWSAFGRFLFDAGVLVDADGAPLTTEPDFGSYFTTDLLTAP
nr:ABC transporter substrate-binding protein [Nakamurella flavida]